MPHLAGRDVVLPSAGILDFRRASPPEIDDFRPRRLPCGEALPRLRRATRRRSTSARSRARRRAVADRASRPQPTRRRRTRLQVSQPSAALTARAGRARARSTVLFLGLGAVSLLVGRGRRRQQSCSSGCSSGAPRSVCARALGATKGNIRTQFLSEAILLAPSSAALPAFSAPAVRPRPPCTPLTKHWQISIPTTAWARGSRRRTSHRRPRRALLPADPRRAPCRPTRGAAKPYDSTEKGPTCIAVGPVHPSPSPLRLPRSRFLAAGCGGRGLAGGLRTSASSDDRHKRRRTTTIGLVAFASLACGRMGYRTFPDPDNSGEIPKIHVVAARQANPHNIQCRPGGMYSPGPERPASGGSKTAPAEAHPARGRAVVRQVHAQPTASGPLPRSDPRRVSCSIRGWVRAQGIDVHRARRFLHVRARHACRRRTAARSHGPRRSKEAFEECRPTDGDEHYARRALRSGRDEAGLVRRSRRVGTRSSRARSFREDARETCVFTVRGLRKSRVLRFSRFRASGVRTRPSYFELAGG